MKSECRNGHLSERYSDGKCKECVKARVRRYATANREKVRAANKNAVKKYELLHPERRKASKRRWNLANKAFFRDSSKRWYWNNRDKAKEMYRRWMRENLALIRVKNAKREAQQLRAMPVWAEADRIALVYQKAREWGFEVDHIVPLQNPNVCGLHVWANLQLLSKSENSSKRNLHWPDMP